MSCDGQTKFERRLDFIFGASDEGIKQLAEEEQRRQEALNDGFLEL
jgi:hypothetical protein